MVLQPGSYKSIIVRGSCEDIDIQICLDTGAQASLISTRLVHQIDMIYNIKPTNILIQGLGKKCIPKKGEITLQIKLAGMQVTHKFVVIDNIDD